MTKNVSQVREDNQRLRLDVVRGPDLKTLHQAIRKALKGWRLDVFIDRMFGPAPLDLSCGLPYQMAPANMVGVQ